MGGYHGTLELGFLELTTIVYLKYVCLIPCTASINFLHIMISFPDDNEFCLGSIVLQMKLD